MDQEKWIIYCYDSEIKHEISTFEIQKQKCPCNILIPIHFPVDIRGQHKWNIHFCISPVQTLGAYRNGTRV